ncbi:MAG: hypothetical protein EOO41_00350, partial [Methanobacteriota archaeon]
EVEAETAAEAAASHDRDAKLAAIRERLEFLFSDSNLAKDRYMQAVTGYRVPGAPPVRELSDVDRSRWDVTSDGTVPLALLLTFPRLRALTRDVSTAAAAAASSSLLVVSDDGARIHRRLPFAPPELALMDARTVYVEDVPPQAQHDALRTYFARFGAVLHVSLPREPKQRLRKGFAFIEFATPEAAQAAAAAHRILHRNAAAAAAATAAAAAAAEAASRALALVTPPCISVSTSPPAAAGTADAGAVPSCGGLHRPFRVWMKADWCRAKERRRAHTAPPTPCVSAPTSDGSSTQETHTGCCLRVSGIPVQGHRRPPPQELRAALALVAQPRFLDCPALFASSRAARDMGRRGAATKLAHSRDNAEVEAGRAASGSGSVDNAAAIVRYATRGDAEATLAALRLQPIMVADALLSVRALDGEEERAYLASVAAAQAAYQLQKSGPGAAHAAAAASLSGARPCTMSRALTARTGAPCEAGAAAGEEGAPDSPPPTAPARKRARNNACDE